MGIEDGIKDKMKGELTITQRVAMYIPGYRGYREKNLRRDEDRAVRQELSRNIQGTKADLANIHRGLIGTDLMSDVEMIRTKVDRYDTDIKKAVNGYSAFHASVKVTEDDLDRIVHWDAKIMDDIQDMRKATAELLKSVDEGLDCKAAVREYERGIDALIEDYNQREAVMKGIKE